jgi:hypothetical protein
VDIEGVFISGRAAQVVRFVYIIGNNSASIGIIATVYEFSFAHRSIIENGFELNAWRYTTQSISWPLTMKGDSDDTSECAYTGSWHGSR